MPDDLPGTPPAPDPALTPPPTADPGRANGRSSAQLATDKADWVRFGGDPAAFDQAITGAPSAAPAPAATPELVSTGHSITPTAARELVAELRKFDPTLSDERLAAALRGNGYSPDEAKALLETVADPRNADQKSLDRGGLGAPVSASEYGPITYPPEFSRSLAPGQLQAFDAEAKTALVAMEVPALAGPSLVQDLVEASQVYRDLSPAQRDDYHAGEDQKLATALGSREAAKDAVDRAAKTLAKAPTAFLEALNASGALRSASVILQLANAANLSEVRRAVAENKTLASYSRH